MENQKSLPLKGTLVSLKVETKKTSNQNIGCKVVTMGLAIKYHEGLSGNAPPAPVVKTAIISRFLFPNSVTDGLDMIRMVTKISRTSVVMQTARINPTTK